MALTRSTAELSTITANVPVLIAYVDASERFGFVNEYVRDVLGVGPADVVGRTLRDMLGGEIYDRPDGRMSEVLAGMPQTFEASLRPRPRQPRVPRHVLSRLWRRRRRARRLRRLPGHHAAQGGRERARGARTVHPPDRRCGAGADHVQRRPRALALRQQALRRILGHRVAGHRRPPRRRRRVARGLRRR